MYLLSPGKMHHDDEMKRVLNKARRENPHADLILGSTLERRSRCEVSEGECSRHTPGGDRPAQSPLRFPNHSTCL